MYLGVLLMIFGWLEVIAGAGNWNSTACWSALEKKHTGVSTVSALKGVACLHKSPVVALRQLQQSDDLRR
jgi:hypothetical protein